MRDNFQYMVLQIILVNDQTAPNENAPSLAAPPPRSITLILYDQNRIDIRNVSFYSERVVNY